MPVLSRTVLDCLPDGVVVLDRQRNVLIANRTARDLLGTVAEERDLALTIRHPDVLNAADQVLSGMVAERTTEVMLPVPVPRAFGIQAIAGEGPGDEVGAVLVLTDVTQARRAEQMRADFVANASHELRSPLTAMLGFIETLKGPASNDTQARGRFLDIMQREAGRMARLIDDLLSLSWVEVNEHIRPRDQVRLPPVLEGVRDLLAPQAAERNMEIHLDLPSPLPQVVGDTDELTQVFRTLIENAVKYGRAETPIVIAAESRARIPGSGDPGVSVHVIDQGEGIPREALPRLTERFYRVDTSRTPNESGVTSTGLGLAIVKHIVSRHRGRLSVTSELGLGSTFSVHLPSTVPPRAENDPGA